MTWRRVALIKVVPEPKDQLWPHAYTQIIWESQSVNMKLATTALVTSLGLLTAASPTPIVDRRAVGDPMCGGTTIFWHLTTTAVTKISYRLGFHQNRRLHPLQQPLGQGRRNIWQPMYHA